MTLNTLRKHKPIVLEFDFESLERCLRSLSIPPKEMAELMGMKRRNLQYIREDANKMKIRSLLSLTNQTGLDIREFFVEVQDPK